MLSGTPGLSDLPLIGRLFATHHKEAQQTDIILTLTPHIVRVLDLPRADLRPFRLGRDSSGGGRGTAEHPSCRRAIATTTPPARPGHRSRRPDTGIPAAAAAVTGRRPPPPGIKKPGDQQ